MCRRREPGFLIYSASAVYADLILNGDPQLHLKTATVSEPLEN